jgi:hypothetical protein
VKPVDFWVLKKLHFNHTIYVPNENIHISSEVLRNICFIYFNHLLNIVHFDFDHDIERFRKLLKSLKENTANGYEFNYPDADFIEGLFMEACWLIHTNETKRALGCGARLQAFENQYYDDDFFIDQNKNLFPIFFPLETWDIKWRTSDTSGIAQMMYMTDNFSEIGILNDALMDAGCEEEEVFEVLTSPYFGRGCWLLEQLV